MFQEIDSIEASKDVEVSVDEGIDGVPISVSSDTVTDVTLDDNGSVTVSAQVTVETTTASQTVNDVECEGDDEGKPVPPQGLCSSSSSSSSRQQL